MDVTELKEQITKAIVGHSGWKLRLNTAISIGRADISPENAGADDKCPFGKWLQQVGYEDDIAEGMPYTVVRRLHTDFHQVAGAIIGDVVAGDHDAAKEKMLTDYKKCSDTLVLALRKWRDEA